MSVVRSITLFGALAGLVVLQAGDRAYSQVDAPAGAEATEDHEAVALPRLHGRIPVIGEPPELPPFVDCDCDEPVPDESVVVGPDGGLANCIIYLKQVPERADVPAPPEDPLIVDVVSCRFVPRVSLVRCSQPIIYRWAVGEVYNVREQRIANGEYGRIVSPVRDQQARYDLPERRPMLLTCDIHAYMSGWHMVLDHPWCAITDENGHFEISSLPEGELEFVAWHERKGYIERSFTIEIEAGSDVERNFEVAASDLAD